MKRLLIALGASLAALPVLAADYDFVGVPRLPGAPETVRREEHRRIHRTEEIEEHIRTEKVRPGVPTIPQPPVGVGYAPIGFPVGTPPLPCRRAHRDRSQHLSGYRVVEPAGGAGGRVSPDRAVWERHTGPSLCPSWPMAGCGGADACAGRHGQLG
jgi:hypothetical protein